MISNFRNISGDDTEESFCGGAWGGAFFKKHLSEKKGECDMEKKTIGGFIAALRKANGMTQRELAEKLSVSDKAVSRWERDECAPDLTLIPVLADIFGVTTDEILRGERKNEGVVNLTYQKEKSKKQMQHLFEKTLLRFKDKSWISIGIALCGYLLVLLFNFAVLRGDIGFFIALIFYVGAVITQICFTRHAVALRDEDFDEGMQNDHREQVILLARNVYFLIYMLFAVTLPFAMTGRAGFVFFSWLAATLAVALIAFVFGAAVYMLFIKPKLIKKAYIIYEENEKQKMLAVNRLLKKTLAISLAVAILLLITLAIIVESTLAFAKKEVFYDFESFGEYMARKEPLWFYEKMEADGSLAYYVPNEDYIINQYGDPIYAYERWNQNVWTIDYKSDEDGLPIFVVTDDAYNTASDIVACISVGLLILIVLDLLIALIIYIKKWKAIRKNFS